MSLLQDLREKFTKAQSRQEELTAIVADTQEVARKRQELELQIEAEELALEIDGLEAEFKSIIASLPVLYFDFEQQIRSSLRPNLLGASYQAFAAQRDYLTKLYRDFGCAEYTIWAKLKLGGSTGLQDDPRYSPHYHLTEEQRKARHAAEVAARPLALEWLPVLANAFELYGSGSMKFGEILRCAWDSPVGGDSK